MSPIVNFSDQWKMGMFWGLIEKKLSPLVNKMEIFTFYKRFQNMGVIFVFLYANNCFQIEWLNES